MAVTSVTITIEVRANGQKFFFGLSGDTEGKFSLVFMSVGG